MNGYNRSADSETSSDMSDTEYDESQIPTRRHGSAPPQRRNHSPAARGVLVIGEGPMAGVETARMRGNSEENRDGDPSATDGDPNANQGRPPDSDA